LLKNTGLSEVERTQLGGEKLELLQELKTLEKQRDVLMEKRNKLLICAPISGEIMMDWDVQKSLKRRPVTTGQILMSVADPAGDWELELHMRESRVGHVRTARNDERWRDVEPKPGKPVPGKSVTFILATNPGTDLHGVISEIKGATELHPEEGVINKIKVGLERKAIGNPHPGATVTADVYCGRSSVAYSWFHEAWEWVQARILFYLS